jgi:phosphatidylserine/phosphatidylglycerophosphate/cardiolipin synthase-like enzyme
VAAIRAYVNSDHTYVAWRLDARVPDCRGFALRRRSPAGEEVLDTWVGFAGDTAPPGTKNPSTEWPIQKFTWSDYDVPSGVAVSYRAVPMVGAKGSLQEDDAHATDWSDPVTRTADVGNGMSAYFNRGVVATQWLARRLRERGGAPGTQLQQIISTPGDPVRNFLGAAIVRELPALLEQAQRDGTEIYAALFELDDPQLLEALKALGARANVVLANGADVPDDENAEARQELRDAQVNVFDRLVRSHHFGHNKFLVLCDANGDPRAVWTGSTNWTKTGLCTQANNALLIEDAAIAGWYRTEWEALRAAGSEYPPELRATNDQPRATAIGDSSEHVWFAPVHDFVDLEDARARIQHAKQGILFLMFNPGPAGTLLNDIIERTASASPFYDPNLYIHGVLNQDPSTDAHPIVGLFRHGEFTQADLDVVLPAAVEADFGFWIAEILKLPRTHAMVHSKCIVVDPFGATPVVMTGSHNMGPKASSQNDDNLVIVEGAPRLAAAYAVNIIGIYDQYRWRFRQKQADEGAAPAVAGQPGQAATTWAGLQDDDTWQDDYLTGKKARELRFWLGEDAAAPG